MKKTYKIEVDCANCANKMEEAAKRTPGVKDAVVSFMTLKMTVELYILLHYKRKERRQVPLSFPNLQLHFLFADCHFVHYLQHSVFNLFLACPPSPLTRFYLLVRFPDSHALFLFDRYKAS